ncbi:hypothetical protein H261_17653 [Paramagnetospirillum caucaseum]|uniref:Uncharacterized protein n=1 Tax=Paramagnetospirillum caucaseum TaxID=1244869 RepID=M2Y6C7_9PROT|nr:hypothetical protein [Paramagnetospirillum caucaseum]EME68601.1 hypothetical protein H261_17653 [Paramagnetospirillum caucaseum]
MTFEFAPDWMETLLRSSEYSPAHPGFSPLSPAAIAPAHPDAREMAALVGELFAEGTLSAEQFRSLLAAPELEPYLDTTLPPGLKTS